MGHLITPWITIWGIAKLLFQMAAPFYFPTGNAWGFQSLLSIFYIRHPRACKVTSHGNFYFISLMTNDVKYLFLCLLAIWISSLEKGLFRFLPIFKLDYLTFYYWVLKIPYIVRIQKSLIRYMICKCFLLFCVLSFLMGFLIKANCMFWLHLIYLISFVICAFGVTAEKLLPHPKWWGFTPMFYSKIL